MKNCSYGNKGSGGKSKKEMPKEKKMEKKRK